MSDPGAILAACRALRDLSAQDIDALALLVESREVYEGGALFREGDDADELFVIAQGNMRLERGREPLGVLGAGEMLGGACLASIGRRACDAIASGPVRVLALSRGAYLRLRADFPSTALALHEGVVRELALHLRALGESRASSELDFEKPSS